MRTLLVLLLLGVPTAAEAQRSAAPDLPAGTHVRIQAPALPAGRTEGVVWYLRSDTLHLLRSRETSTALPVSDIQKIEVRRRNSLAALGGLVVGGAIGGVVGYTSSYGRERPGLSTGWHVAEVAGSAAVGAALGGVAGALIAGPWRQVFPARSR